MSTANRRRYRIALLHAAAAMFLAGGAAAQQSPPASTSGQTTNLGTIVVAPDNAPRGATATKSVRIQRSLLKLNINTGPGGGGASSKPHSTPARAPEPVRRTQPRPLHVVPPQYPSRALARGIEGSVTVAFKVNRHGHTTHIRIVKSSPPGIFDEAARRAVRQWRFQPATRNNKPVVQNVKQTINFNPPPGAGAKHKAPPPPKPQPNAARLPADHVPSNVHALHIVAPSYPSGAFRADQGGHVKVRFVVKPDGHTSQIRVLASRPHGVFDRAAINAVRQWRFKPLTSPAVVVQTITFTPPDQR